MEDIYLRLRLHRVWRGLWDALPDQLLPLRVGLASFARRIAGPPPSNRYDPLDRGTYAAWLRRHDRLKAADRALICAHARALPAWPVVSIVMAVRDAPHRELRTAISTVRAQLWPHWELCIAVNEGAPLELIRLLEQESARDHRIRVAKASARAIPGLTNVAIGLARGDFVATMAPDAQIAAVALYEVATAVISEPSVTVLYTDEDRLDTDGRRYGAWLKPDFDADLLLGQNLLGHLAVYSRQLLHRLGGLREITAGAASHDLALRATAEVGQDCIRHIPAILYHGGRDEEENPLALRSAVTDALAAVGLTARVEPAPLAPNWARVIRPLPEPAPLVSIIVPTRDRAALLSVCAEGVLHHTSYPAIEFVVVDNGSEQAETHALFARLRADPRVRILVDPGHFNYSALNNRAVREAQGDILVLLNNDTKVMEPGWLREMVSHAVRPEIGAVGAKLYYADDTLQHGGIVTGVGGVADHYLPRTRRGDSGYFGSLALVRQVAAVTGACLALRRAVYEEVGGLNEENLAVSFNDVDLCLRIRQAGYRILWTPFAELYHLESASRGKDISPEKARRFAAEIEYMKREWGDMLICDPFYNPSLCLDGAHVALAEKPRRGSLYRGSVRARASGLGKVEEPGALSVNRG